MAGASVGVIFDLDGVLVHSEPYWQRGFAEVVNRFCVDRGLPDPGLTASEMSRFQGGRVNDTVATILRDLGHGDYVDATTVAELTDDVIDHVSEQFAENANAIESSVAVARQLADRGIRLAVASSSAPQFIEAALQAIGLADAFPVTQSALGLEHGKPDPEVYRLTLARMGLEAHEAIAIEDSTTGLAAAARAGLATIWLQRDVEESEAESRARLRAALGADGDAARFVRKVTRDLTMDDVENVMKTL